MTVYQIVALTVTVFCVVVMLAYLLRIVKLGTPKDHSKKSGSVAKGVVYANTAAMLPNQKESSYLHLPTYSMGIIFHIGIFIAFLIYFCSFFTNFIAWLQQYPWLHAILLMGFLISSACGIALFLKRIWNKNLRNLSNADDFISNGVVTLFQIMTLSLLLFLNNPILKNCYYIAATLLFMYMPLGKLKHVLYYFFARYHLGFFYGWRNVWPPKS
ncbi:MAG: hypothetical protein LBV02_00440 [Bacteroidales bacterium]|jgi:nitrate reductase gamma subunit|nr:hypothetical protein [Bacteroidales bacterium]